MASSDLNRYIADVVRAEIDRALSPFTEALTRLNRFLGTGRRGPGRPPKSWAGRAGRPPGRPSRGGPRRGRPARKGHGDASKFQEGQAVRYKQGRGEFDAKVLAIDTHTNLVTVQRTLDRKRVVRPASKIYAA